MPDDARLTAAQRRALMALTGEWVAPKRMFMACWALSHASGCLAEIIKNSSGWRSRLTPAGIALKARLEADGTVAASGRDRVGSGVTTR
jgi:hypothetical protein